MPVAEEKGRVRALDGGKSAAPEEAARYVERAFGKNLRVVRKAMKEPTRFVEPAVLNRMGLRLDEHFRPEVPAGAKGRGANDVLDLDRMRTCTNRRRCKKAGQAPAMRGGASSRGAGRTTSCAASC